MDSFVIYTKYIDQIELLDMEQRGLLLTAIMYYASGRDLPEMDAVTAMAFAFIRAQIDADKAKYQKTVEARREAGRMGGRPKAKVEEENQNKAKKANGFPEKQNKAKKHDNDSDNDNDSITGSSINTTSSPEPKKSDSAEEGKVEEKEPVVASFLLNDKTEYDVTLSQAQRYQELYPGIDCMQELRKIVGWCESNPANRKTRNGAPRFVNGWLARAQDKARPNAPRKPAQSKPNRFHNFDPVGYDYDAIVSEFNEEDGV